jgi:hypothetical protein
MIEAPPRAIVLCASQGASLRRRRSGAIRSLVRGSSRFSLFKILSDPGHRVGDVREAKDRSPANLCECIERGRFHLDC